jgi:hypothetical protein
MMPNFFVPFASTPEQAEETYQGFLKMASSYPLTRPNARLFRIAFEHHKRPYVAEVGEEISGWPEKHGVVLGIIETTELITVLTRRSILVGDKILVGPPNTSERVYFDDYRS